MKYKTIFFSCLTLYIAGWLLYSIKSYSIFPHSKLPLCPKCNVVFISIDTLRADELPCLGYRYNTAPNICQLFDRSVTFERAFAQSSWTLPSNFSYFTSQFPSQHNVQVMHQDTLPAHIPTLPQIMKAAGYHTIYMGPDEPSSPLDKGIGRGFDTKYIHQNIFDWSSGVAQLQKNAAAHIPTFLYLHAYDLTSSWRNIEIPNVSFRFDPTITPVFPINSSAFTMHTWKTAILYLSEQYDDIIPEHALPLVQGLKDAQTLSIAKQFFDALPDGLQNHIRMFATDMRIDPHNPRHMRYVRALYDEELFSIDQRLKAIITALEQPDVAKNTIVVFTSDHGEEFGEHGGVHHGRNLYETTTHVPLSFYIPTIQPRYTSDLIQGVDIAPTILATVGITPPQTMYGINMLPAILGQPNAPHNTFITTEMSNGRQYTVLGLRTKRWSYYVTQKINQENSEELYDILVDPTESHDVSKTQPSITQTMSNALNTIRKQNYLQHTAIAP